MTDRVIRVILDPSGVEAGARRSDRALKGVETRTGTLTRGIRAATVAASGLIAALSARELIRTADTFNRIQNRLRIVTDSTDELVAANERLFDIAQETRQPLEATVNLFTSASIAADELGASEEELFRLVEITGQALAVQGSSAAEASGALRQLSQSFSSGIVRAEEFNSILEGAFPLAQAAARGIDEAAGSVGKLRTLVVEGKITSQAFFEAILEGGEELGEQFGQTIPTVSQAITTLNNSFITVIGSMDETLGITSALASGIVELSEDLTGFGAAVTGTLDPTDELSVGLQRVSVAAVLVGQTFSGLFDLLGVLRGAFVDFGENLGGIAAAVTQTLSGNFAGALGIIQDLNFDETQGALTDFFGELDQGAQAASDKISQILIPSFRAMQDEIEEVSDTSGKIEKTAVAVEDLADETDRLTESFTGAADAAKAISESFDEDIEALEHQLFLLSATNEQLGANAEARALAAGATDLQAERIGELTETLANEQEALRRESATLEGFFEEVGASAQRTLSGFLADPLSDGLDELPGKFAQVLQQLAADALSSELFSILGGLATGGAGGGAGSFLGLVGSFFGGGMQAGGQAMGGRPILVGERGPEIFTPPGSGSISPNVNINQAAQAAPVVNVMNITDPADIPAGLRTAEGEEEVINIIQRNPDAVRRILG